MQYIDKLALLSLPFLRKEGVHLPPFNYGMSLGIASPSPLLKNYLVKLADMHVPEIHSASRNRISDWK